MILEGVWTHVTAFPVTTETAGTIPMFHKTCKKTYPETCTLPSVVTDTGEGSRRSKLFALGFYWVQLFGRWGWVDKLKGECKTAQCSICFVCRHVRIYWVSTEWYREGSLWVTEEQTHFRGAFKSSIKPRYLNQNVQLNPPVSHSNFMKSRNWAKDCIADKKSVFRYNLRVWQMFWEIHFVITKYQQRLANKQLLTTKYDLNQSTSLKLIWI